MLTPERLKEVLRYYEDVGLFVALITRGSRVKVGDIVGCINTVGYSVIMIDGKLYTAHRLAFLYMMGRWPVGDTDHINNIRTDNRWCNLREATRSQNNMNSRKRGSRGRVPTSPLKGAYRKRNKWGSEIHVGDGRIFLGYFDTAEEAHAAYVAAAIKYHGEFARSA